ncbi:NAD-dependent epimerase [Allomuricauda sp. d1]|uniref:NAD-dependent epimerase n=1 Tax=Allomuricauda sp. d1 TaxID=3136725 RepID=UPI0031E1AA6B
MKVLVTGAAGFIGFHTVTKLMELNHQVVGLDNLNDYYTVDLKYDRLEYLGIDSALAEKFNHISESSIYSTNFKFVRMNIEDRDALPNLFNKQKFDVVCNLAAQAGVRYSIENPEAYVDSNIVGFLNILECCRHYNVNHLVYASSSSVYGQNRSVPFKTSDSVDHPISLYAATKKSNELMAHTYSHLFNLRTTGLRFFTVYGPWGRPDMALFLFTEAIVNGKPIKVFNNGDMQRDFTYIDDIVEGVVRIIEDRAEHEEVRKTPYKIYNIGNSKPVHLLEFIDALEDSLGIKAIKHMLPMQPGDVSRTWASVENLSKDYGYHPSTPVRKGVEKFVEWHKSYCKN